MYMTCNVHVHGHSESLAGAESGEVAFYVAPGTTEIDIWVSKIHLTYMASICQCGGMQGTHLF